MVEYVTLTPKIDGKPGIKITLPGEKSGGQAQIICPSIAIALAPDEVI